MLSLRPTALLKIPLLRYPGPPCHTAASVLNAPGLWTRDWALWTLTLAFSHAPRLPVLTCGALFCTPRAFLGHLTFLALLLWMCNMSPKCPPFLPPTAKAKPLRNSQAHDTSTAHAGTSNASQPSVPQVQEASTAHAGTPNVPHPTGSQEQDASTAHAGRLAPVRNADRTGYEPSPKLAALVFPISRLAQPRLDRSHMMTLQRSHELSVPSLRAPVESWPSSQE